MIIGAHVMLQSRNPSADKAFFGGVLNFPAVDAGGGFLIFRVPAAEVAIHDSDRNDVHQLYLMCSDARRFVAEMQRLGIACTEPRQQRWGTVVEITLPGGGRLGVYEPNHPRPEGAAAGKARASKAKRRAPAKRKPAATRRAKPRRKTKPRR
ncbi:MAG TPA: hypothetical protein VHT03_05780 [Rhizomicrobium sp.]|jgi:hypothetical protein|nr:hypothetical protein [Rhizomicrobium sp.]